MTRTPLKVHRPQDHPPVTVNLPRRDRQGDPARRVLATLCQHTSYTGAFTTRVVQPIGKSTNFLK